MDLYMERKAIRKVAKRYGISEQKAVQEIELAIQAAFEQIARENDVDDLAKWMEIPCAGTFPNAYELVDYLSNKVNNA